MVSSGGSVGSDAVAVDADERRSNRSEIFEEDSMLASLAVGNGKKSRRSSLNNAPTYYQTNLMKEDKRQRRASLSGAVSSLHMENGKPRREELGEGVANAVLGPVDGYDAETDGEMSSRSMRSMHRRASLKAQRRLSNSHAPHVPSTANNPYSNIVDDDTEREEDYRPAKAERRMSAGRKQSRRSSNGQNPYGYEPQVMTRRGSAGGASRRGSNGVNTYGYEQQVMHRRGSNGANTYGYEPQIMTRRGSAGGASRRGSNGVNMYGYEAQTMTRRGSAGTSSRRGSNGVSMYGYGDQEATILPKNQGNPVFDSLIPDSESESEHNYGYGVPYNAKPVIQRHPVERRGSNASRASARSRRRNSCLIRKDQDQMVMREILAGPSLVPDSDLEDSVRGDEDDVALAGTYGYSYPSAFATKPAQGNESDSENTYSTLNSSASRRRARRNSCIIRPDQFALGSPLMPPETADGEDECAEDDYNDPDSLLNKSGYGAKPMFRRADSTDTISSGVKALDDLVREVSKDRGSIELTKPTKVANQLATQDKTDAWIRKTPFTTAYASLTEERLAKTAKAKEVVSNMMKTCNQSANWGELDFDSYGDSSSEETDEEEFGPRMYEDKDDIQEYDSYRQRARRRSSIERTFVNIAKNELERKSSKLLFTPAESFNNASDYVVRAFTARMRLGITVIKHNQSRWSKSTYRKIMLEADGRTLVWKPIEGEKDKGKRPKLDLSKCIEVRHALSRDPSTRKQVGTSVLRKRCKDNTADKSFALIFKKRTLDFTAVNMDQCLLMIHGFSALCYRLKMDATNKTGRDDVDSKAESLSIAASDDWASTVYGESTVSMTFTSVSKDQVPPPLLDVPWGL